MLQKFRNRTQAGKLLAARLTEYAHCPDILVLGLPRGGVPVAY
ncbi:phosphoribosyltransferase, partial [Dolichospermum circinale CS-545/17]|nr:phosphoribosyltransferase [Dolichospermum circinale CS-545/17]